MKKIYTLISLMLPALCASAQINDLWVMGAVETGWRMGGTQLDKVSDGVFNSDVVLLAGDFKFNYEVDNWGAWIWATSENKPVEIGTPMGITATEPAGDYKFINTTPGAYSLTVDLNSSTLTVDNSQAIYCVGEAAPGGWDLGKAIKIESTGAQIFSGKITLGTGEFKFLANNHNFASSIMAEDPGTEITLGQAMPIFLGDGDNKWICTTPGTYNVTVVLGASPSLTITKDENVFTPTTVIMSGKEEFTEVSGGIFKGCLNLGANSYKFQASNGSENKWLKFENGCFDYVDSADEATAFDVTDAAFYQMTVNTLTQTYAFNPYTAWTELYIVGNFNTWVPQAFTADGESVFTWQGDIEIGSEVKFIGYPDYDHSDYELHPYIANTSLAEAKYCCNGGPDNKWIAPETLNYTITVNTATQTIEVETAEATGITDEMADAISVRVINGTIVANSADVTVYDMAGRRVSCTPGAKGIYIVKAGNKAVKIAF